MKCKLTVFKNFATMKTELRVLKYDSNMAMYMNSDGQWLVTEFGMIIPPTLSIPIDVEIEILENNKETSSQLKQKDSDKNYHIENLNDIIKMLIKV